MARLQEALDVLLGMVDRVSIHTDVKMMGVVCQPCYMADGHLEAEYVRRMTGVGLSFRECKW